MNDTKRGIGRIAVYAGVVGAMMLSLVPAAGLKVASAAQNCRNINKIDVCARFLEVWNAQGSEQANVYVNGLPITARRAEIATSNGKTYDTQWFERARMEAHPENKAPYDVELGLLGVALAEGRGSTNPGTNVARNAADQPFVGIDKPADADQKAKYYFAQTKHSISGKILEYWLKYGGNNATSAIKQFGFPLSEQFQEVSQADGKTYTVQYFERNRFELHPEKQAPYEVELGLLGVEQYKLTPVPAASLPTAPPKGVTTTKETATIAISQLPASLFTVYQSAFVASIAGRPTYAWLVAREANDKLFSETGYYVPLLENGGAKYAGVGDDKHLVVKYKIRWNIHWSDGKEITAQDGLYYYKLSLDPLATILDRSLQQKVANIDVPGDNHTLVVNFLSYKQASAVYGGSDQTKKDILKQFIDEKRPVVDPNYFAVLELFPNHILGKIPANKIEQSDYVRAPIHAGPFIVQDKNWASANTITLVPNPNYDITDKPLLKRIVIKVVTDTNQVIAQLKTGALDGATSDAFSGGPSPVLDTLKDAGQQVDAIPARVWEHFDFNLDKPQFKEKAVRQAVAYAIDRQNIVNQVYYGKTKVLDSFLPPLSWGSSLNPDFPKDLLAKFPLTVYKYDPAKANQMLDAAGWAKGGDGVRAKGGARLSIKVATTAGNKTREQTIGLVIANLKAVGIDAVFEPVPAGDYFADDGYLAKRQHDMALYAWILDPDPGGQLYDSNLIPSPENNYAGQNYPGFRNARFDQLSRATASEIDTAKRLPMLAEMQSIWSQELPSLPVYTRANIDVHKANLMGWQGSGGTTPPTYNTAAWYFK